MKKNVLDAVRVIISQHDRANRVMRPVEDCEAGEVSKHLLRVVLSYVDYLNHTVWSKNYWYSKLCDFLLDSYPMKNL